LYQRLYIAYVVIPATSEPVKGAVAVLRDQRALFVIVSAFYALPPIAVSLIVTTVLSPITSALRLSRVAAGKDGDNA